MKSSNIHNSVKHRFCSPAPAVLKQGLLFLLLALPVSLPASPSLMLSIQLTPTLGDQNQDNNYKIRLYSTYQQSFEGDISGLVLAVPGTSITTNASDVINGSRSVRLLGTTNITIPSSLNILQPGETYVIEYSYKVLQESGGDASVSISASWTDSNGLNLQAPGGPKDGINPSQGRDSRTISIPAGASSIMLNISGLGGDVIIDDLDIYRIASRVFPATPPLIKAGFPRLSNYNLFLLSETAVRNNDSLDNVVSTLGLYDFINGLEANHIGTTAIGEVLELRKINPDIILVPYFESFIAQLPATPAPPQSLRLLDQYNAGLQESWFMHDPAGVRLEEPLYPGNYQMNHTIFGGVVDGYHYNDYARHYLTRTVLPVGLWDGIHFDESIWFPNPLLTDANPFTSSEAGVFPPIDLDNDGIAEPMTELKDAWRNAFFDYFFRYSDKLGYSKIIFGNSGEIPSKPSVLNQFNGAQREFSLVYRLEADGDWDTTASGGWYDMMQRYDIAMRFLRAPQLPSYEFTGYLLGTPSGFQTANNLPDREKTLESRDFRRMRLGLTSVLLGDGFFGYDYVDNTTTPLWFDEYAVNSSGIPEKSLAAKGYLGQPLAVAEELGFPANVLVDIDFETLPVSLPPGVFFGPNVAFTSQPGQAVDGQSSMIVTIPASNPQVELLMYTDPTVLGLDQGKTYNIMLDYRILDYQPVTQQGVFTTNFARQSTGQGPVLASATLWNADAGLTGKLRTAFKVDAADYLVRMLMIEAGTIAFDNIKIVEGTGGVWRRDFENGIVLVNPTPEAILVPQADIDGPLFRSGVRRIQGVQDPLVNNGSAVTDGITIPSGDGIILLADRIQPVSPGIPPPVFTQLEGNSITLFWLPASGTVAGYIVRYGKVGGNMTEFVLLGRQAYMRLDNLDSGTDYEFRVAAYDYRGSIGSFNNTTIVTTTGATPDQPILTTIDELVPGQAAVITGTMLSDNNLTASAPYPTTLGGVRVMVNGLAAEITSILPNRIDFITPTVVAGNNAILYTEKNAVRSAKHYVGVSQVIDADFNNDAVIDALDVAIMMNHWDSLRAGDIDLDGNNIVDTNDLDRLLGYMN